MTHDEIEVLAAVGRTLWQATLIGHPPPMITKLRDRMTNPQPGDLVMEVTRFGRFDPDSIGRLIRHEGTEPGDRWVIEPLSRPGEEQGWQNAMFVALPDRRGWSTDA